MRRPSHWISYVALVALLFDGSAGLAAKAKKGAARAKVTAKSPESTPPAEPAAPAAPEPATEDKSAKPAAAAPASAPTAPAAAPTSAPAPAAGTSATSAKPAAAAATPATVKPKAQRIRVTVLPLLEKNFSEQAAVPLQRELADALRRNTRLDMKDLDVRLAEFAQEMPFDQVELARTTLQNGRDALQNLEIDQAITQISDAVDQLVAVLPYIKKQELADAMMFLATAQHQKGNNRAVEQTLKRLLTWRTTYQLDTDVFPQALAAPLEAARDAVAKLPQGQLKALSEPAGAQVFVDGEFAGVAPLLVSNLAVGEHYVTFKKLGYKRGLRVANVTPNVPAQVLGKVDRAEKYLLVEQAISRVGPKMGESPLSSVVDNLRETLFLDHTVFLKIGKAGTLSTSTNEVSVSAYLYDLRSRKLLNQKSSKITVTGGVPADGAMAALAEQVYTGVNLEQQLEVPVEPPTPVVEKATPLYKRWWFWTAIGVIAAGGAAAIAVGVTSQTPSCPEGHSCTGELIYSLRF